MYKWLLYLYAFVTTFLLSCLMTSFSMKFAMKIGKYAIPQKDRLHKSPVPILGGIGIVGAFYLMVLLHFCVLFLFNDIHRFLPSELVPYIVGIKRVFPRFITILLGGVLIFFLGILDDVKTLGPKRKIFFEILVGLLLYYSGIRVTFFTNTGVSIFLTVFWIVSITNSFNLLDNMDGLSSGVAMIAAFITFLLCIQGGQILVSLLLIVFIGAIAGFLRYNYPPAKVFMGDAGSLFIGYLISVIFLMSTFYYDTELSLIPVAAPILILAVPIYDTLSVVLIRIKNKKSIFVGDKNHFSHRLLRLGMSMKEAALFIYLIALCLGMAALTMSSADLKSQIILLLQAGGLLSIIYLFERINIAKERK